jgi:hypothetical protein
MIAKVSRKNTAAFHNVDKQLSRGRCLFREFDKTFFSTAPKFFLCQDIFLHLITCLLHSRQLFCAVKIRSLLRHKKLLASDIFLAVFLNPEFIMNFSSLDNTRIFFQKINLNGNKPIFLNES